MKSTRVILGALAAALLFAATFAAPGYAQKQNPYPSTCTENKNFFPHPSGWTTYDTPVWPMQYSFLDLSGTPAGLVSFEIDPLNPLGVFATDGDSIFRSEDGGCTWEQATPRNQCTLALFATGSAVFATHGVTNFYSAGCGVHQVPQTIAVSRDKGKSWEEIPDAPGITKLWPVRPAAADEAPALYGWGFEPPPNSSGLYFSDDGGASWERRAPGTAPTNPSGTVLYPTGGQVVIDPADANHLWATGRGMDDQTTWDAVIESRDGGRTWSEVWSMKGRPPDADTIADIAVFFGRQGDPPLVGVLHCHAPEVALSLDGGQSFSSFTAPVQSGGGCTEKGIESTSKAARPFVVTSDNADYGSGGISKVYALDARAAARGGDPWIDLFLPSGSWIEKLKYFRTGQTGGVYVFGNDGAPENETLHRRLVQF